MTPDPQALAEWTAANRAAIEDYQAFPNRACDANDECPGMTRDVNPYCLHHRNPLTRTEAT